MRIITTSVIIASLFFLMSCESVQYVKNEISGDAKPEGGVQEQVPPTMTFNTSAQSLRKAVLEVLDEQNYDYEENPSTGIIKTEPKPVSDTSKFGFFGAHYYAKIFIKLEGSKVSYRAKFDKKSNVTTPEQNIEYPEKENEIRKQFFDALAKKVGRNVGSSPSSAASEKDSQAQKQSSEFSVIDVQKRLNDLGYNPGPIDGKFGKKTADAIKKFQEENNLAPTGTINNETVLKLRN